MHAFIKFNRGMLKMPLHWQLWVMVLVAINVVAPLFYLHHVEARVVLGTVMASMALMTFLTGRFGFTRIVGLGHVLWVPMLAYLYTKLDHIPATDMFGIWIRALFVLNALSLMFDAADAVRYFAGDRQETVQGL